MRVESEQVQQSTEADAAVVEATVVEATGVPSIAAGRASSWQSRLGKWLVAGIVMILVIVLVWFGPRLWQLARNEEAVEAWVIGLGWWGPLALVALNALQIVIAPIPGYVFQAAAGFLFGPLWGGVWASLGLLLGSSIAFWLARFYGRPLVGRLVGEARLVQWEHIIHSDNTLLWFFLLLGPIGDLPYFLAGLARVSSTKILVITLAVRVPSTFVVAAAGAGVLLLTWWQTALLLVALFALLLLFLRYQDVILQWMDRAVQSKLHKRAYRRISRAVPVNAPTQADENAEKLFKAIDLVKKNRANDE